MKSETDNDIASAIKTHLRNEIIEIDCGGNIGNLAAIFRQCSLCISNDSGPRHLAVAVGTPSLAFFRFHHDKEWDVYRAGEGCATLQGSVACSVCPPDKCFDRMPEGEQFGCHCLRMISLDDAIRQVERMLSAAPMAVKQLGDTDTCPLTRETKGRSMRQ